MLLYDYRVTIVHVQFAQKNLLNKHEETHVIVFITVARVTIITIASQ